MEARELFSQSPVFSCLTGNEQEKLLRQALIRQYHKGQYLTHAGDIWPYIFLLAKGTVAAVKESLEGRSLVATSFKPGDVFWGVSFFHPELPMPVDLKVDLHRACIYGHVSRYYPSSLIMGSSLGSSPA